MKRRLHQLAAFALSAAISLVAQAQEFPNRPIHLIVPAGAGTTTDIVARLMADGLSKDLKQPVIVENRTGASGNIAHAFVARAAPDGYTLILGNTGPLSINKELFRQLAFDPIKDFTPVKMVGYTPTLLVVKADSPWNSVKDLIAYARENPDKVSYSSAGNGTTGHLAAELLKSLSNTSMVHVPYKEGTQAVTAVIAGDVAFMFYHPAVVMPQIKGGRLKALGLSSAARSAAAPGVIPLAEQGYPGFDLTGWWALGGPGGLPPEILKKLVDASDRTVKSPQFIAQLAELGIEPLPMTQPELVRYIDSELTKWSRLVKLSGARVD